MTSAKVFIYGNRLVYFHISLKVTYGVAENNVTSTVNQNLRGGVHVTLIRSNEVLKWHTEQMSQTYIFRRDMHHWYVHSGK